MFDPLISMVIAGFVFFGIYYLVGIFIRGRALRIVGLILGLIFLVLALFTFRIVSF